MQVCGFVDGLVGGRVVGSRIYLYPLFPLLFFVFVFGYRPLGTGIQKWVTHSRTYTYYHQRRGILKCVGGLFALRMRERVRERGEGSAKSEERERGLLYCIGHSYGLYVKRNNSFFLIILFYIYFKVVVLKL